MLGRRHNLPWLCTKARCISTETGKYLLLLLINSIQWPWQICLGIPRWYVVTGICWSLHCTWEMYWSGPFMSWSWKTWSFQPFSTAPKEKFRFLRCVSQLIRSKIIKHRCNNIPGISSSIWNPSSRAMIQSEWPRRFGPGLNPGHCKLGGSCGNRPTSWTKRAFNLRYIAVSKWGCTSSRWVYLDSYSHCCLILRWSMQTNRESRMHGQPLVLTNQDLLGHGSKEADCCKLFLNLWALCYRFHQSHQRLLLAPDARCITRYCASQPLWTLGSKGPGVGALPSVSIKFVSLLIEEATDMYPSKGLRSLTYLCPLLVPTLKHTCQW